MDLEKMEEYEKKLLQVFMSNYNHNNFSFELSLLMKHALLTNFEKEEIKYILENSIKSVLIFNWKTIFDKEELEEYGIEKNNLPTTESLFSVEFCKSLKIENPFMGK